LVSIGLVLSEEKIFEKVYDVRRTTDDDDGRQVMAIAHLTLGSGELNIEEKVVHIAQRNQKRGVKEKKV
jgi:hypothetical protein